MSASAPVRGRRQGSLAPNYIILTILLAFALGPLLVMFFNSIKGVGEIGRNPLGPPQTVIWENFPKAWDVGNFSVTTRNSAILVVGTVVGVLLLGGMAAYSLAKLDMPGSGLVMLYLIVGTSIPIFLYLVPLFFTWQKLGLVNSLFRADPDLYRHQLSICHLFPPRLYGATAARFRRRGARRWRQRVAGLFRIVVPLAWPGFLTVGLVVALSVWNEFLLATVFLTEQELFTVVTSYYSFATRFSRDWTLTSAASVMMILPVVVIFLALQRRFIEGLTQGGIRG